MRFLILFIYAGFFTGGLPVDLNFTDPHIGKGPGIGQFLIIPRYHTGDQHNMTPGIFINGEVLHGNNDIYKVAEVTFSRVPWWIYFIIGILIITGFILNNFRIKSRVKRLLKIEQVKKEDYDRIRKKVALDFHDEIGNHLASISLLVQIIKSSNGELPGNTGRLIEKIDLESKNLFQGSRDYLWSIDPSNNNLKAVIMNIYDYGLELFEDRSIKFTLDSSPAQLDRTPLSPGFTRHLVLIFKEGINNTLKRSGCKSVSLSARLFDKQFEIRLTDDGHSVPPYGIDYIEGIRKMKNRGTRIKGNLLFKSNGKAGTEIILRANLSPEPVDTI